MSADDNVLPGRAIDSFREIIGDGSKCDFKKCRRRAKVMAYYDGGPGREQKRAYMCYGHALGLANESIGWFKFPEYRSDDPLTAA